MRTTRHVGMQIEGAYVDKLKEIACRQSLEQKKDISYTDLIRLAVLKAHPELLKEIPKK